MEIQPNQFYHIYNQGNNKEPIFYSRENYIYFLKNFRNKVAINVDVLAYCLMPNHFHFLVHTTEESIVKKKVGIVEITALMNGFRQLESGYAQAINKQQQRSGSLFRQKTKVKLIEDTSKDYLFSVFNYIHQNPLRAGLVERMEDWEFSSFLDYAGLRNGTLCNKELAKLYINYSDSNFMEESKSYVDKGKIRLVI
jgi:putative transposase